MSQLLIGMPALKGEGMVPRLVAAHGMGSEVMLVAGGILSS